MNYRNLLISALLVLVTAQSACFDQASKRYGIHPDLLRAISTVESNGNTKATNRNGNGSRDIGLMQINSSWLPKLARCGITEQSLYDPCTNTLVGAWVLAGNFRDLGYNWNAIGACTAQPTQKTVHGWAERPIALKKIFDVAWFDGDWRLCEVGVNCRNSARKTAIRSIPKTAAIPAAEKIKSDQIQVHFALNSADPKDLSALKQFLEAVPDHKNCWLPATDSLGDETYNQLLARKRANKVSAWIRKRGIRNPIEVASRGACCYLAANDTEKGRALNRRVVVEIIHEEK